jgi:protein involved in polysaccharide export with SLBB domain
VPFYTANLKNPKGLRRPGSVLLWFLGLVFAFGLASCGGGRSPEPPSFTTPPADSYEYVPEVDAYKVLVNDELTLTVLGSPELSGPARVLPDGTMSVPGVGSVYVLGLDLSEVTQKVTEALGAIVRFPRASVAVTKYGDRRIFVMGEVVIPGDHEYHRGMSTLGAIAEAGGFKETGKRNSVMVMRRLGASEVVAFRVDLTDALEGKNLGRDLLVKPFDIIYVPKTFIASVNILMDQYFRQLTPPFSLYIEGWQALHLAESNVRFVGF